MWRLAFKQLKHDKLRSILTALAISCAISMILILSGFELGLYVQSEDVVLNRGGQLIATQSGISNFFVVRSSLPQVTRAKVEDVEGVAQAHPVTGIWVIYGAGDIKLPLFLMVHDIPGVGGPNHIIKGKPALETREIVVDQGFSKRLGLDVGDPLIVSDFEFVITGITEGDSALFSPLGFVTFDSMIDLFLESEIAPDISTFPLLSFLLIDLKPGYDPYAVRSAIEKHVPDVDIFSPQELAKNDRAVGTELFGPIMGLLVSLSYVIGMLVIGLIIYSDVTSRQRTYGVMKALGFRLSHIAYSVLIQSLILVSIAWPIGLGLSLVIAGEIETNMPVYLVRILDPWGLAKTLLGVFIIMFIGSLLPLRLIAKTDPQLAFQVE